MKKKKVCSAKNCNEIIKHDHVFCAMHWTFLTAEAQDELMNTYVCGQCLDTTLVGRAFRVALEKARAMLYQEEKRFD